MKTLTEILLLAALALPFSAEARGGGSGGTVHVRGHMTKAGTYVPPHVRTAPNESKRDNYSTRGKVNPYTRKQRTK